MTSSPLSIIAPCEAHAYIVILDMVFSNGCRAPPWRQVLGDLCYIKVTTPEDEQFYVTASTEGYYINKVSTLCTKYMAATLEKSYCNMAFIPSLYTSCGPMCQHSELVMGECGPFLAIWISC